MLPPYSHHRCGALTLKVSRLAQLTTGRFPNKVDSQHCLPRKRRKLLCRVSEQTDVGPPKAIPTDRLLKKLRRELTKVISEEDYVKAAEIRDKIQDLENNDPVLQLEAQLQAAIEQQDFEEAIRCRDELRKLRPEKKPKPPLTPPPPTTSDTLTNGVRVQIKSSFLPYRSSPGQFVFMYRVRIVNEAADGKVKLHQRHWVITDANSYQDQVRGDGVLGEQPELGPGEEHVYSSYVPIRTPTGKMVGRYRMQKQDEAGIWQDAFDANVGAFGLDMSDSTPAKW